MSARRLRDALASSVLLAALTWSVRKERAFRQSRSAYVEIDDALVDWEPAGEEQPPGPGAVVHFASRNVTAAPLSDLDFGVKASCGLRLGRHSEMCQWVERSERRCKPKSVAKYVLELVCLLLVDILIMTLIGSRSTSTSTLGVPDLNNCWTEHLYDKAWVKAGWVDHTKFHTRAEARVNPHPKDWPPAKEVLPSEAVIGGLRVGSGLLRTLGKTATAVLVFGAPDCGVARGALPEHAAWACGQQAEPLREGYHYQGEGWFVREHNVSRQLGASIDDCGPGDVRVRYTVHAPSEVTVVGRVDADRSVDTFPLRSRTTPPAGFLEQGVWSLRELTEQGLGREHGHCRHSRMCLLLALIYAFLELRHHGPASLSGRIRSLARLAVLLLVPTCLFAVHLGLLWALLYGLSDWRGQETSRPQLSLLAVAAVMLVATLRKHEALTAALEHTSLSVKRLVLIRENASFFRVVSEKELCSPGSRRMCIAQLGLGAAIAAAAVLMWLGLTNGAEDLTGQSASRLELTLIAAAAVAVVAAVAAATAAEAPPIDAMALAESGVAQGFTTFDCPICLETTPHGLVLSPCGHTVCTACWPSLRDWSSQCPQCRRRINSAVAIDRQVESHAAQFEGVTQIWGSSVARPLA